MDIPTHDALIIGGGPAGLAGALYLGRFRRRVLVVDAGDSRAARIPRSHNVAGFPEGISGRALIDIMRRQAEDVGVRFLTGRVDALAGDTGTGFVARGDGVLAAGRAVLLATGSHDVEPPMPDVAGALARGALRYCPVCDGYEAAGRAIGLLCDDAGDLGEAHYLRHFSDDVQVFLTRDGIEVGADDRARLAQEGIVLHEQPLSAIAVDGDRVAVDHGGRRTVCDALYSALGMRIHSELAVALGAAVDDDGYLVTDRRQQTTVAGLWAAGDVARGLNQISVGIGAAAVAASAMHQWLRGEGADAPSAGPGARRP